MIFLFTALFAQLLTFGSFFGNSKITLFSLQSTALLIALLDAGRRDIETHTVETYSLILILLSGISADILHSLIWGGGFLLVFILLLALNASPLPGGDMKFLAAMFFFYGSSDALFFFAVSVIAVLIHMLFLRLRKKNAPKAVPFIPYAAVGAGVVNILCILQMIQPG